ncbi:hypothetical protein HMPREF9997_02026 [Corynebacterium durum F0235]|uniref:Uncharacterized protein n=1 Tax=Corynebacterium durum F0235 TaxID=1035195 RepID=L1MDJ0_9CORY|nr:hypothetical protein HMPREF9997_02026 [Corynebacterium durum F0235]
MGCWGTADLFIQRELSDMNIGGGEVSGCVCRRIYSLRFQVQFLLS